MKLFANLPAFINDIISLIFYTTVMNATKGISLLDLLRDSLHNPKARFKTHQQQAIELLIKRRKGRKSLLVVEKTGWGKSAVYFLTTKILRTLGKGPTIIISPLIALMNNQIEAAKRMNIKAVAIHSENRKEWDNILDKLKSNAIDVIFIAPEKLADDLFNKTYLNTIITKVALLVIDEAHCISVWGHDFRPDYRRILAVIKRIPRSASILATTATANNRVIEDISDQLPNLQIIQGALRRKSLALQNIILSDQAERLAWLKENIPQLKGSGIIYTLTKHDAEQVASYLNEAGIPAKAYHSEIKSDDPKINSIEYRLSIESLLYKDELKVVVATIALGMGYDKPNLGFVIHYQAPNSIITYYQQVGRAGRGIEQAYGILLSGKEDNAIQEHFISRSFPKQESIDTILKALNSNRQGLTTRELMDHVNLSQSQIEQVLKFLSVEKPAPINKLKEKKWVAIKKSYKMDEEKKEWLLQQKQKEWKEVQEYIHHKGCLMSYLQHALNDNSDTCCEKCSPCIKKEFFSSKPTQASIKEAAFFLKHYKLDIPLPQKLNLSIAEQHHWKDNLAALPKQICKVLSKWGDAGWGSYVAEDKHHGKFRIELVNAMAEMLHDSIHNYSPAPTWVTCIPSGNHPTLVSDFAEEVAKTLHLPFYNIIKLQEDKSPDKREKQHQKWQLNSSFQFRNRVDAFAIFDKIIKSPVLLIDDVINSGWTLKIVSALLYQAGCLNVYPAVLSRMH